MKLLSIVLFSVLVLGILSRRVNHLGIRSLLQHYADDIEDVEKKIFKDVLTDKEITQLIVDGKTGDDAFKKTVLKKTLAIVGGNDEYLKSLAKKIFDGSSININDEDRLKILRVVLQDETASNAIIEDKQDVVLKRIGELISQDKDLTQNIAKEAFAKIDTENKLSDTQKAALLRIYLNNPQLISKQTVAAD
jgi:hypothetical protein